MNNMMKKLRRDLRVTMEGLYGKASLADLLALQKLTLMVDSAGNGVDNVLLPAMEEVLGIQPSAEKSNEQLVREQSLDKDSTLTRGGTDAVLLNSLNFLEEGLRSFRRNADLSEVQFLADLLFAHEQETIPSGEKRRDNNRRCLIADVARERVMKASELSPKAAGLEFPACFIDRVHRVEQDVTPNRHICRLSEVWSEASLGAD